MKRRLDAIKTIFLIAFSLFFIAFGTQNLLFKNVQKRYISLPSAMLSECIVNIITISNACEKYAQDHDGMYPESIPLLIKAGKYIKKMPRCPTCTAFCTYRYTVSKDRKRCGIWCDSDAHKSSSLNPATIKGYPQYDSETGIITPDKMDAPPFEKIQINEPSVNNNLQK